MGFILKVKMKSRAAFFLSLFLGLILLAGCTEVKTYMAQRDQDKALENLKKGALEGQVYKNQLYECEITGSAGWKAELAYPEALVTYTKEDKVTRIKLEVREIVTEKKIEIKDLIAEKEKVLTYKKINEQEMRVGKKQGWEVNFEGRWREDIKGESVVEKVVYFETDKFIFLLSLYTLKALGERNEDSFLQSVNGFNYAGAKAVKAAPVTPSAAVAKPEPPAAKTTSPAKEPEPPAASSPTTPKPPSCTPKYTGKVTAVSPNQITFNLGSQECIRKGVAGKVYYEKVIAGTTKKVYIARFKVTTLFPHTSNAQIIENTDEIKKDYFVQVDKK